jgi:replicative superfamily II helicase
MYMPDVIEGYLLSGATEKGIAMSKALAEYFFKRLDYFMKQEPDIVSSADYEIQTAIQYISKTANALKAARQDQLADEYAKKIEEYYTRYIKIMRPDRNQGN